MRSLALGLAITLGANAAAAQPPPAEFQVVMTERPPREPSSVSVSPIETRPGRPGEDLQPNARPGGARTRFIVGFTASSRDGEHSTKALVEDVRIRARRLGLKPLGVAPAGGGHVEVDFAEATDALAFRHARLDVPAFAIRLVDDVPNAASPSDEGFSDVGGLIWVRAESIVTGSMILSAVVGDQPREPSISIILTREGRTRFAAFSSANLGHRVAIVLNGKLLSAPNIIVPIANGRLQITGDFTEDAAAVYARAITEAKAGDMPLTIIEERPAP
jgi:preprotein translocase subunit SecD